MWRKSRQVSKLIKSRITSDIASYHQCRSIDCVKLTEDFSVTIKYARVLIEDYTIELRITVRDGIGSTSDQKWCASSV